MRPIVSAKYGNRVICHCIFPPALWSTRQNIGINFGRDWRRIGSVLSPPFFLNFVFGPPALRLYFIILCLTLKMWGLREAAKRNTMIWRAHAHAHMAIFEFATTFLAQSWSTLFFFIWGDNPKDAAVSPLWIIVNWAWVFYFHSTNTT